MIYNNYIYIHTLNNIMMDTQESTNIFNDIALLTDSFSKSLNINVKNNTPYNLYLQNGSLYSGQIIKENTVIGEINGYPCYIWEINHNDYIIIDNEMILNTQIYKEDIVSYVREENETSNISNCFIKMYINQYGNKKFYLVTKSVILPCEEIVYSSFDFQMNTET